MKEKKLQTCAANAFGSGQDLVGKIHRGKKIVSATRKHMTLEDGTTYPRKGNHVQFEMPEFDPDFDWEAWNGETEGDRL